jgi:hypothetical protein
MGKKRSKEIDKLKMGRGYIYVENVKTAKVVGVGKSNDVETQILLYSGGVASQYSSKEEADKLINYLEENRSKEDLEAEIKFEEED